MSIYSTGGHVSAYSEGSSKASFISSELHTRPSVSTDQTSVYLSMSFKTKVSQFVLQREKSCSLFYYPWFV